MKNSCVFIKCLPLFLSSFLTSFILLHFIEVGFNWFQFISIRILNPNKFVPGFAVEVTDENTSCSDNSKKARSSEILGEERGLRSVHGARYFKGFEIGVTAC